MQVICEPIPETVLLKPFSEDAEALDVKKAYDEDGYNADKCVNHLCGCSCKKSDC